MPRSAESLAKVIDEVDGERWVIGGNAVGGLS